MGSIKMKDKTAEAVSNLDAQILKNVEIAEKEQAKNLQWDDPAVRGEDEAQTDEYSRHYYLNNGTAKSVISAVPVNFYDDEEKAWKQIDNTLEEQGDVFVNKAGAYKTEISKANVNKSVKMTKKDLQLSWTYLGKQSAVAPCALTAEAEPVTAVAKENTVLQVEKNETADMQKTLSRAVYENIEHSTDLEYCLQGNNLKENIIVKEKSDDYRYMFALNTQGLSMRLSEDSTQIELCSGDKTEFTIPAPYMYDAAGAMSEEVYYELDSNADGSYTFAVVADPEWLNAEDRAMPVTIDPQIVTSGLSIITKQVEYRYRYTSSSSGYSYSSWYNSGETAIRVMKNSSQEYRTKITINKSALNMLKNRIASAKLTLTPTKSFSGYMKADGIYKYYNGGNLEINLTSQLKSASTSNIDIWIEPSYYTYEYIDGSFSMTNNPPILEVEYFTNENTNPTIEEFSLAGCMSGALNLGTGELTAAFGDATTDGTALSLGVSHHYKKSGRTSNFGKSWRLNVEQKLEKNTDSALDANYIYTDAAGEKHGFKDFYYYLNASDKKVYVTDKASINV